MFTGSVEHAIAHIEESIAGERWTPATYGGTLTRCSSGTRRQSGWELDASPKKHLEEHIRDCEKEPDDDAEHHHQPALRLHQQGGGEGRTKRPPSTASSTSDKIDKIVTNRILALPIFIVVMYVVYSIAITLRHLPDGLDNDKAGRRLDDRGSPLAAGELGHRRLADGPCLRRHCAGVGAGFCSLRCWCCS